MAAHTETSDQNRARWARLVVVTLMHHGVIACMLTAAELGTYGAWRATWLRRTQHSATARASKLVHHDIDARRTPPGVTELITQMLPTPQRFLAREKAVVGLA